MRMLGYTFTVPAERPDYVSGELMPERFFTFSSCLTVFLPGTWALDWVDMPDAKRHESAEKFGFNKTSLPSLIGRTVAANESGEHFWPNFFSSLEYARAFVRQFQLSSEAGPTLLGLGIRDADCHLVLDEFEGCFSFGAMTDSTLPIERAGGDMLGWEPLGIECSGTFHSWLCNGIEKAAADKFGIRPANNGLLSEETQAVMIADAINAGELSGEPVPWYACALVRYSY